MISDGVQVFLWIYGSLISFLIAVEGIHDFLRDLREYEQKGEWPKPKDIWGFGNYSPSIGVYND